MACCSTSSRIRKKRGRCRNDRPYHVRLYRHYQFSEPRRERNAPGQRVETGQWKSLAEILVIPLTIEGAYIIVAIEDPVAFDLCAVVGAPYWLFFLRNAGPKLRTCKTLATSLFLRKEARSSSLSWGGQANKNQRKQPGKSDKLISDDRPSWSSNFDAINLYV